MATIKLGELLIKANVLQETQLKSALAEQQKWGGKLGDILVRMNLVTEEILIKALSKQLNIAAAPLDSIQGIAPHVKAKLPREQARDLNVIPLQLRDDGKTLVVAMMDPQNVRQLDTLRAISRCRIVPQLAGRNAIQRAYARFYDGEAELSDFEGSFKVVDAQGRTVVKSLKDLEDQRSEVNFGGPGPDPRPTPAPSTRPGPPLPGGPGVAGPRAPGTGSFPAASSNGAQNPSEMLKTLEDVQRREVAAIKAMVELLIEKKVFSREEYLAKVKR
ncbi:MAG TPA: hypothetical protein VND93_06300 [Myxococcales bacterium]|nr:hypothetical protein [Myxococcales bacterium]